jgi:hypothetical protein
MTEEQEVTSLPALLSDRPVGNSEERLWASQNKAIRDQLEQIAATFAAPLGPDKKPAPSLTIAVTGPWGSGKSSALRVLSDLTVEKVRALAPPGDAAAADALASRLSFCRYAAPVLQATAVGARTTLVVRMLVALAGSDADAVRELLGPAAAIESQLGDVSEPSNAEAQRMWNSVTLDKIASAVSGVRDFDRVLGERLKTRAGEDRVLVVLIDDLDRCDPAFVYAVLSELSQLVALDRVFFVVAAEWSTLCRAVRESAPGSARTEAEAEHELAKLVQHTVSVPLLDEPGARVLLDHLLDGAKAPAAKAVRDNVDLLLAGLPEPTPRAVKRCLNFMMSRLSRATARDLRADLKRLLLEHTWEGFYRRHFEPMTTEGPAWNIAPIVMLEQAVSRAEALGGSDRRLAYELAIVCDEFPSLPWRELPLRLVRFLGAEPSLVAGPRSRAPEPPPPPVQAPPPPPPHAPPPVMPPSFEVLITPEPRPHDQAGGGPGGPPRATGSPESPAGTPTAESDGKSATEGTGPDGVDDVGVGTPESPSPPPPPPALTTIDGVLAGARADVMALADPRARLERAAHALFELSNLGRESDAPSLHLSRVVLPELCKDPRDGRLLSAVLDRHVTLLRRYGLRRSACAALDLAYRSADYVSYVRDAYSLYLLGAGAVDLSRRVTANQKIEYHEVLSDDPQAQPMLTAVDPRVQMLLDAAFGDAAFGGAAFAPRPAPPH